jgi:poly-gamma-glutamate capsule biosynthesis protein CapA/YwtB (metallophosphatase superfamily)
MINDTARQAKKCLDRTCRDVHCWQKNMLTLQLTIGSETHLECETDRDAGMEGKKFLNYLLAPFLILGAVWAQPVPGQEITADERGWGEMQSADKKRIARSLQTDSHVTLFMTGDVMTGRGIDQALPFAGDPVIYEPYMKSAAGYLRIAEEANGPIPRPAAFSYVWGDALDELKRRKPDLRLINLETSITASNDFWQGKGINYRMHPQNVPVLTQAGINFCALANNHILDWGYTGLLETRQMLQKAKIASSGAGRNLSEAAAPAVMTLAGKGRVLVFSFGLASSGIPLSWAAAADKPGVNLLTDLSDNTVRRIAQSVRRIKHKGDIVVASIHWGGNWGYKIPAAQKVFAHRLIDQADVDVVHGHSSHHVKGIEVYKERLILYGCGDFINDYEGIGGYEEFRADLSLMYFVTIDPADGKLGRLQIVPTQIKRFRVNRASTDDTLWLKNILNREGNKFGTRVILDKDHIFNMRWD